MMDTKHLLVSLSRQGIECFLDEGKLKTRAAPGAITPEIATQIKANKAQLIALLDAAKTTSNAITDNTMIVPKFDRHSALPLSFSQQRLWFIDSLEKNGSQYNLPTALKLTGDLDIGALQQALNVIVERHEILRTYYAEHNGEGRQCIAAAKPVEITWIDIASYADESRQQRIEELVSEEVAKPFDLTNDLMLRVSVIKAAEHEHVLLFTMHHIASDGWSLGILVKEFSALYSSAVLQQLPSLTALPLQYADFAMWQRSELSGEKLAAHLSYWQTTLADMPEIHQIPLDYIRPANQSFAGKLYQHRLSVALQQQLQQLAKQHNVTLFMLLQSAFALLIGRWSNSNDVVMGTPSAGRQHKQVEALIGFFVNSLVLRNKLDLTVSFNDYLTQSASNTLDVFNHQAVPFELLVDELQPTRSLSHTPLFQIMFSLQNFGKADLSLPNLTVSGIKNDTVTAKFDLELSVATSEQGLNLSWTYASALFDEQTITSMAHSFEALLEDIILQPNKALGQLNIVPAQPELGEVRLAQLSQGKPSPTPLPNNISSAFDTAAALFPNNIAAVHGDRTITYQALFEQSNQLANHLLAMGVQPKQNIGLCCHRSIEMVVSMLAILKVGGAYVPLDVSYPQRRTTYMLEDSEINVVLGHADLIEQLALPEALQQRAVALDHAATWQHHSSSLSENAPVIDSPNAIACIFYTSGTTGNPKGTLVTHQGILRLSYFEYPVAIDESNVFAQLASISFDAASFEIWTSLLHGSKLAIYPQQQMDLDVVNQLFDEQQVDTVFFTAGLFDQWSRQCQSASSLRLILTGGDVFNKSAAERVLATLPKACLSNIYGPTECTTFATIYPVTAGLAENRQVPIGHVLNETSVHILDSQQQPQPIGAIGELYIGGKGVVKGYLNQPELTQKSFVRLPRISADTLYRTGDMVRFNSEGQIEFIGRVDHQVKVRGFRIELSEIEHGFEQHALVKKAKVLALGEKNNKVLVCYVLLESNELHSQIDEIARAVSGELPNYMTPDSVLAVEQFPLTVNGKLDTNALTALYTVPSKPIATKPKSDMEQAVCKVWSRVLNTQALAVDQPFFKVGGNSINMLELKYELTDAGLALSLKQLMEHQTIAAQASLLEQLANDAEQAAANSQQIKECIVKLNNHDGETPLFIVHPFGGGVEGYRNIATQLAPYCGVYGIQAPFMFGMKFNHDNLVELAQLYCKALCQYWSGDTIMLAGYSGGGQLAAIMTKLLKKEGKIIKYVALFDAYFEDPDKVPNETSFSRLTRFLYSKSLIDDTAEVPQAWQALDYPSQLEQFAEFVVSRTQGRIRKADALLALAFSNDLLAADMMQFTEQLDVERCHYFISDSNLHYQQNVEQWTAVFGQQLHTVSVPYPHDVFMDQQAIAEMMPHIIKICDNNKN
ncbi:non-ribosomal peptide synthetase [Flocculibacter collagenilyticus]|uniref:non-ribosomal peptide synthetase n=1 Tax=Flocculibacter collagenilyticus TaxID=2744479 RepID=UPI0018F77E4C|nr:non-ribosomal peptide synthetase [Flocculibacter collagenilyticus]